MGRLVYQMSVSLDGFVETRDREIDWTAPDDELHGFVNEQARNTSAFLWGRRTYELMNAFWPTADADPSAPARMVEFARIWRPKPKVVFSKTLSRVEWNARLVQRDPREEVAELKQVFDGDLWVGGPGLASTFARLDLIDEYRLILRPVILGGGTPFFPPLAQRLVLRLAEARAFGGGVLFIRYVRRPGN